VVEDFYQTAHEHRKRRKKNQNISTQVETKISNKSNNKEKQQWLKRRETVLGRETKAKVKSNIIYFFMCYLKFPFFGNIPLFLFNFAEIECTTDDTCPKTMCTYPFNARCVSFVCQCVHKKSTKWLKPRN
jgi:hypothetical protein